jgi:hypothetical protein
LPDWLCLPNKLVGLPPPPPGTPMLYSILFQISALFAAAPGQLGLKMYEIYTQNLHLQKPLI